MGWYEEVEQAFEKRYGEPLVAGPEWVEPIVNTCEDAVECDPALTLTDPDEWHAEIVTRTCDVIAVMTHGVQQAQTMRAMRAVRSAEATS